MKKSTDAPPAYTASTPKTPRLDPAADADNSNTPPPNYTPLTKFTIGNSTTPEPLVSIVEIKGHLALLQAFAEVKRQVQASTLVINSSLSPGPRSMPEDKEQKWTWFVGLAVERFDLWCRSLNSSDASKPWHVVLPPIDVLMVWHAYMLNPRWYSEDCMRIPQCQTLKSFEPHFKMLLRDPSFLLNDLPSKERYAFWVRTTRRAGFDPLEEMRVLTKKVVMCPNKCPRGTEVDFVNRYGTGYFQKNFKSTCARLGCPSSNITKGTLALRKLADDLADRDPSSSLAGTLFTSSPADKEKGRKIKQKIHDEAKLASVPDAEKNKDGLAVAIMKHCSYSLVKLGEQMGAKEQPILMKRIMSAYNDEKAYSVELIGAVLRQGSFVGKMHELGWTLPGFFDQYSDELALHHALARYHAFLDLMSSSPASFFVPTLDIDLVWHTHQLMPGKYDADCNEYLQRFIDHDDKVENMKLSSAFDITCHAWKERFRVQYTHCGCPIPGDTIDQRLSRMVGIHSRTPASSSHLVPIDRPDTLAATHASDHNAVRFLSNNLTAHRLAMMRQEIFARKKAKKEPDSAKVAKKRLEDRIEELKAAKARGSGLSVTKPNATPPSRPQPRSNNNDGRQTSYKTERYSHETPFLLPVPLFFGGGHGGAGGGCMSDGHNVSSVGACSSGGGGSGGCGGGSSSVGSGIVSSGGVHHTGHSSSGACGTVTHSGGVHHSHSSGGGCGGGSSSGAGCGGGSGGGGGSACGSSGGGGCGGGGGGGCGGC